MKYKGSSLETGLKIAGDIAAPVSVATDLASLIAGFVGADEQAEEEKKRYEREQGLNETVAYSELAAKKREQDRKIKMSNALAKALGRRSTGVA